MSGKMYESAGEMDISEADDMNIPVCCFMSDAEDEEGMWEWTANNYMPRKNYISEGQYCIRAKSKDVILKLIAKHVAPLYATAMQNLLTTGTNYYWEAEK